MDCVVYNSKQRRDV